MRLKWQHGGKHDDFSSEKAYGYLCCALTQYFHPLLPGSIHGIPKELQTQLSQSVIDGHNLRKWPKHLRTWNRPLSPLNTPATTWPLRRMR